MMFTRPGQPDILQASGPAGSNAAWPIASSPIHLVDGAPATRVVRLPYRAAPPAPEPAASIVPQHRLDSGLLSAAEIRTSDPAAILATACREAALWMQALAPAPAARAVVRMASGRMGDAALAHGLKPLLAEAAIPSGLLELAFAESDLAGEGQEVPLFVSALRDLGAGVALDQARACRHLLRRLPLTAIRLHPCLIRDLEHNKETRRAVQEVVRAAHAGSALVTALGVQTRLQCHILADLQCDEAQGPHFSGEMPAEIFRAAL